MRKSAKPASSPHHHEILVSRERRRKGVRPTQEIQQELDDRNLAEQETLGE